MKRSKIKKEKYIHSRDDQKSAVGKISDAVSPVINEMDGKPISGGGYTHNTHTHTHTQTPIENSNASQNRNLPGVTPII